MDKTLAQLEETLRQLVTAHEDLLKLLECKRAAVRTADHKQAADCCQLENQKVQLIAELEKLRLTLVAQLTLLINPSAAQPMRMEDLAQQSPEPARGRLLVLRQQLRQRMEQVRTESAVTRRAAEALVHHMQGLLQSMGAVVTGIGVYSRKGAMHRAATAVSTFSATA